MVLSLISKERIESRGAIAKEVNLDVQIFRPQQKFSLLDTILQVNKKHSKFLFCAPPFLTLLSECVAANDFGVTPHPVIIVPAMLVAGNLSLANVK